MGNGTTIDSEKMLLINRLLFERRGDELFQELALLIDEVGLRVGDDALEWVVVAVRSARSPQTDGEAFPIKPAV